MLRTFLLLFLLAIIGQTAFSQATYQSQIHIAEAAHQTNNYKIAALSYRRAFTAYPDLVKALDVFRSARAWAAAGNSDSAIIQLQFAATTYKFNKFGMLMSDSLLSKLRQRKEWAKIAYDVHKNMEANYTPLQKELALIKENDQKYRLQYESILKAEGAGSPRLVNVIKQMTVADSVNLEKVKTILDTHGWPPYSEIADLNQALFLVIQHADLPTQLKYLPIILQAKSKNDIYPGNVALLEDRIAVRQGKSQIYGSQVTYDEVTQKYKVYPIEDEANVNKRRAAIGMEPLQDYLKQWNIVYLPENK